MTNEIYMWKNLFRSNLRNTRGRLELSRLRSCRMEVLGRESTTNISLEAYGKSSGSKALDQPGVKLITMPQTNTGAKCLKQ